jgi:cyclase
MLSKRLIPILLLKDGGLMKSKQFTDWKYVGDPLNTAKIFNDKDTDELIVLDVEATAQNREPNYELLRELSAECFLPICYGGGVASAEVARKVISCGVDKVSINSAHIQTPRILGQISEVIGSSSTVASLDIDLIKGDYVLRDRKEFDFWGHLSLLETFGAGEVMVQSVPQDGTRGGPDLHLASRVLENTRLPVIFSGGVSSLEDSFELWKQGVDGVAAGAWFVFSGKHEAVLVTYPPRKRIDEVLGNL